MDTYFLIIFPNTNYFSRSFYGGWELKAPLRLGNKYKRKQIPLIKSNNKALTTKLIIDIHLNKEKNKETNGDRFLKFLFLSIIFS